MNNVKPGLAKVQIETERLLIREFVKTDWEAVHEYAQQGDILTYEAWGPNDEADTKQFIAIALADQVQQSRDTFELAIILKEEVKLIGGCSFRLSYPGNNEWSIGYIINPQYWKNGYATEATKALLVQIPTLIDNVAITATCDSLNLASQKVLSKCGFQLKKILIKDFKMKGRWRDTFVYEFDGEPAK